MKEEKIELHPSQYLSYAGLTNYGAFDRDITVRMRQMGPNVNHRVRQEAVIADICNNFLGNPAKIKDVPDPRMQNDMMSVQLTSVMSARQIRKKRDHTTEFPNHRRQYKRNHTTVTGDLGFDGLGKNATTPQNFLIKRAT